MEADGGGDGGGGGATSQTPDLSQTKKTQKVGLIKVKFIFLCRWHQTNDIAFLKANATFRVSMVFLYFLSPAPIPQDLQRRFTRGACLPLYRGATGT